MSAMPRLLLAPVTAQTGLKPEDMFAHDEPQKYQYGYYVPFIITVGVNNVLSGLEQK